MDVDITQYLRLMVEQGASDMFFSTGAKVCMKIEGKTQAIRCVEVATPKIQSGSQAFRTKAGR